MLRKEIGLRVKNIRLNMNMQRTKNGRFARYFWTISWHD